MYINYYMISFSTISLLYIIMSFTCCLYFCQFLLLHVLQMSTSFYFQPDSQNTNRSLQFHLYCLLRCYVKYFLIGLVVGVQMYLLTIENVTCAPGFKLTFSELKPMHEKLTYFSNFNSQRNNFSIDDNPLSLLVSEMHSLTDGRTAGWIL